MVADSRGRLFVTDPSLSVIHVFDVKQGKHWQIRRDREQPLIHPTFIAVDDEDNIYVTDSGRALVIVYLPNGHFKRAIGEGYLSRPAGVVVDILHRALYVADWQRKEIQVYTLDSYLYQVFADRGSSPGHLTGPLDLAISHHELAVLDSENSRFELFNLTGQFRGSRPFGQNRKPTAFTFDAAGILYYCDLESGGLVALDAQGEELAGWGVQHNYGQLVLDYDTRPFLSVTIDPLGVILALRPSFLIEAVKLEMAPGELVDPKMPLAVQ